jgi:hypothetical protein
VKLTALAFAVSTAFALAACGSAEPSKPAPAQGNKQGADGATTTTVPPVTQPAALGLGLERADQTALSFTAGTPINLAFKLTNADGIDVIVGLLETPATGAAAPTITHDAGSADVGFAWASPTAGAQQKIRFILRDKAKCEAAESADPTRCVIKPEDFGVIGANQAYDVVSDEYLIDVAASTAPATTLPSSGTGTTPETGTKTGLLGQISSLLGGGGGGASGLLGGLGTGQLSSILSGLKGGGSLSSILSMLGLGLTDED